MKTCNIFSCISIISILFIISLPQSFLQGQNQHTYSLNEAEELLDFSLSFDTIRPGLNVVGKGLMYYDYIILQSNKKTYLIKYQEEERILVVKGSYTDTELERMKQNLLFMDKQSRIQIKKMIRKEKWDLNLGEAIKGFYMAPVF